MAACLGRDVPTTDVLDRLKHHFTEVFDVDLSSMTEEELGALRSDRVDISL
jgi:hypothetical protein